MKLTLAIVLVVVLGNVFVVRALKCYSCVGSKRSDCYNGKTSSMVIQCSQFPPSLHSFVTGSSYPGPYQELCLTIVVTNANPDNMFVTGCGIVPGNVDPCNFMNHSFPISSCEYCRSDLCNVLEPEEEIIEVIDVNIL